jgi:hypothetical protein
MHLGHPDVVFTLVVGVKRMPHCLPQCSTKTGEYCKARQRLPLKMVSTIVRHTGRLIASHNSRTKIISGKKSHFSLQYAALLAFFPVFHPSGQPLAAQIRSRRICRQPWSVQI